MRVPFLCSLLVLSALGIAFGQDTNFATGPQYLAQGAALFARPISTPSLSLASPLLGAGASDATEGLGAGANTQTPAPQRNVSADLFPIYYGSHSASVIEISFAEPSSVQLPASIVENGVSQITTAQALRARGYGNTLVEAATEGKARARHATHVYTNADLERLHGGS
jgi:hypothetical protein